MSEGSAATVFADMLLGLKQRTGRGYRDLAKGIFISSAALHRYCAGKAIPPDFTVVRQFARLHGARSAEIETLYRLWLAAQLSSR
jgi:hypothetical protein